MALTPDEIERRTFPVADWGYDRAEVHKFLIEVAATMRYAQLSLAPPAQRVVIDKVATGVDDLPPELKELLTADGAVDYAKVGQQVTRILEEAETLAAGIRDGSETEVVQSRAEAERAAADRLREAEEDAQLMRSQAKKVLRAAQDHAERITAEAEEEATSTRARTPTSAPVSVTSTPSGSHSNKPTVWSDSSAAAIRRLEEARSDLLRAIERLVGSEGRPVVDFSGQRPAMRTGSFEQGEALLASGSRKDGRDADDVSDELGAPTQPFDPLSTMVRAAVERAVEHSTPQKRSAARRERASGTEAAESEAPAAGEDDASQI